MADPLAIFFNPGGGEVGSRIRQLLRERHLENEGKSMKIYMSKTFKSSSKRLVPQV